MTFTETRLPGTYIIQSEPLTDERGSFARIFCAREFADKRLNPCVAQCSVSWNIHAGTLRGMHFQRRTAAEDKLIRCTRGRIYDVALDLRPESPAYRQWVATELAPGDGRMIYVPAGVAHGFQTLEDGSEVCYQMSEYFAPELAAGVRWNDPAFEIVWPPAGRRLMSDRDREYPDFAG